MENYSHIHIETRGLSMLLHFTHRGFISVIDHGGQMPEMGRRILQHQDMIASHERGRENELNSWIRLHSSVHIHLPECEVVCVCALR